MSKKSVKKINVVTEKSTQAKRVSPVQTTQVAVKQRHAVQMVPVPRVVKLTHHVMTTALANSERVANAQTVTVNKMVVKKV